jgi:RNA polymerase sigma-70 factor (ECF subfamily)
LCDFCDANVPGTDEEIVEAMTLAEPQPATAPDERLEACRRGDRAALESVLREHIPMLSHLIARLCPHRAEADDILQNTLTGAVVGFARFRGEASVATWLAQIASRQVQEHWRRVGRRRAEVAIGTDDDSGARAPQTATPGRLDDQTDARRRLARLHHHLDAIAPEKRLAFILNVIDGRSVAEVATMMHATETATRTRVMRARRALIARLRRDPVMADLVEALT